MYSSNKLKDKRTKYVLKITPATLDARMVFAIVVDKKGRSTEGSRIARKPSGYFPRASATLYSSKSVFGFHLLGDIGLGLHELLLELIPFSNRRISIS